MGIQENNRKQWKYFVGGLHMKKEVRLLDHGLFEKPFMDSKARTRAVSTKEIAF